MAIPSSQEGDIRPQVPQVNTPDSNKREIAEQIKQNINEVPQNRNNFRNMTGDELEPNKPTINSEDADAYVKAMMQQ